LKTLKTKPPKQARLRTSAMKQEHYYGECEMREVYKMICSINRKLQPPEREREL